MDNITNRLGGSTGSRATKKSKLNLGAAVKRVVEQFFQMEEQGLEFELLGKARPHGGTISEDSVKCIGAMMRLAFMTDGAKAVLEFPPVIVNLGTAEGSTTHPPARDPFPELIDLHCMTKDEQESLVLKHATKLVVEIEGLRKGVFVAPRDETEDRMTEGALGQLEHLSHVVTELGIWPEPTEHGENHYFV